MSPLTGHAKTLFWLALLTPGLLVGCANVGSAVSSMDVPLADINVAQARAQLTLPLTTLDAPVAPVGSDPVDTVRWGGSITRIENLADQTTLLELVSRPLLRGGRPVHNDKSDGRFIAVISQFLDPAIITVGRDVTVVGALVARQEGKVGQSDYIFPVVYAQAFTYWKKQAPPVAPHFPHWNGHYDPFDDFFWPGRPGRPHRH